MLLSNSVSHATDLDLLTAVLGNRWTAQTLLREASVMRIRLPNQKAGVRCEPCVCRRPGSIWKRRLVVIVSHNLKVKSGLQIESIVAD